MWETKKGEREGIYIDNIEGAERERERGEQLARVKGCELPTCRETGRVPGTSSDR